MLSACMRTEASDILPDRDGGVDGLRGLLLDFMVASWSRSAPDIAGPGSRGVTLPESPEGGLSVHILSRSLSDSSLLTVVLDLREIMEVARGLRWGWSEDCSRGTRRLGRRMRSMNGLRSSAAYVLLDEADDDEEGGRAKSEEEVGSDGRDEGPSIMSMRSE